MSDNDSNRVLGRAVYGAIGPDDIEWWPMPANVSTVQVNGGELQAVCPVTGNPDLYDFTLEFYGPSEPESKSLKMYLLSHRDSALSCASLASLIAHDLTVGNGSNVAVSLTQQTRGGMRLTSNAIGRMEA